MKDGPNIARIAALIGDHARAEILTALVAGQALTATELAQVAGLLESLMGVAYRAGAVRVRPGPREPELRKARVCYDHLAGELGVLVYDGLAERRVLQVREGAPQVTRQGEQFFLEMGIDVSKLTGERRPLCRACLDWSMRRHHLAGALGAAILKRCYDAGWARRLKGSRAVSFSAGGEKALRERFAPAAA